LRELEPVKSSQKVSRLVPKKKQPWIYQVVDQENKEIYQIKWLKSKSKLCIINHKSYAIDAMGANKNPQKTKK
jgi:hypothetical protein